MCAAGPELNHVPVSFAGKDSYNHEVQEHQPSLMDLLNCGPSCWQIPGSS